MTWNGLSHIQDLGGVRIERPLVEPQERGYMTGATSRVLACPECGSIDVDRCYDIGTGQLYPNAAARYRCGKLHWFDHPDHGWYTSYSPDLVGQAADPESQRRER